MKINPQIAASAINRYAKTISKQPAAAASFSPADRIEISDRAQLFASLLKTARQPEAESDDRIHAIVNRLASVSPAVDLDRLASSMLGIVGKAMPGSPDEPADGGK
jgi:hypothetical protein